jgi:hypothetical protein
MTAKRSLRRVRRNGQSSILRADPLDVERVDPFWTAKERSVYNDDLAGFLAGVLQEWIVSNPGRSVDDKHLATIRPEALDKFMWKHLDDT